MTQNEPPPLKQSMIEPRDMVDPEAAYCSAIAAVLSTGDRVPCDAFVGYTSEPRVLYRVRTDAGGFEWRPLCPEHIRQYQEQGRLVTKDEAERKE